MSRLIRARPLAGYVRKYQSGYRTDDFVNREFEKNFTAIRENVLTSLHIHPKDKHKTGKRKIVGVNLPWSYKGAMEIKPDDNDLASIIDGAKHRVGGVTPPIHNSTMRRFKRFVGRWIRKNLRPLDAITTIDIESWLSSTNYSESRKQQLRDCYKLHDEKLVRPDFDKLLSFVKDEFYQEPKAFRTINARHDYFKCVLGPWIHAVEKEVFKRPEFIKNIKVSERGRAVFNKYTHGQHISMTDFTAWEASMGPRVMQACEFQLFKFMTQHIPGADEFMNCYHNLMFQNTLKFAGLVVTVLSRRMSGEMSTSIGNGFTNVMLIKFTCFVHGIKCDVFAEGDDAVIFSDAPIPCDIFTNLGFIVKMETTTDIRRSKFCSLIFDSNFNLIRDPIHTILRLGWTGQRYINSKPTKLMQLLRLKAISLKCEVPNAPILGPLADKILELTKSYVASRRHVMSMELYKREQMLEYIKTFDWRTKSEVSFEARQLVEEEFGIHVESQLAIESDILTMKLGDFNSAILDQYIKPDNKLYYQNYVSNSKEYCQASATPRVCTYQTFLANNPLSDQRFTIPAYAIA